MTLLRRVAAVAVVALAAGLAGAPPAPGATRVLVTVDVESTPAFPLPEQAEAVCDGGVPCGLDEIARTLRERGLAGTFFVNVYEERSWGEEKMRRIVADLVEAGQDVALHTHPHWAYDPGRPEMYQYGLDDQTAIVADGVRLLEAWTGLPVVAHRAGDYGADGNTLVALARNGIRVDSSLFWGNPRSRLNGLGLPRNLPQERDDVLELPVSVYVRREVPRHFGGLLSPLNSVRKVDSDWFLDTREATAAMDALVEARLPVLVLFLHSASFLSDEPVRPPRANERSRVIFEAMLDHALALGLPVQSARALAAQGMNLVPGGIVDAVPVVRVEVPPARYAAHRLRAAGPAPLAAAAAVLALALLAALAWRRRPGVRGAARGRAGEAGS